MSEIRASGGNEAQATVGSGDSSPRLVVQKVGEATIYFRTSGEALPVANEAELRAVAAINTNVFDEAAKIVGEGVRIIREKVGELTGTLKPSALEVELSFGFEVKGKATIVPVLLTGESASNVCLKVTATWEETAGT